MEHLSGNLLKITGIFLLLTVTSSGASALTLRQIDVAGNTSRPVALEVYDTPEQQLQYALGSHIYLGQRITDAMRAATGDPNISVIDKRYIYGDVYSCNYQFWGSRRVLVCD
jgi:hypothetical protein